MTSLIEAELADFAVQEGLVAAQEGQGVLVVQGVVTVQVVLHLP